MTLAIDLQGITKSFPGVLANDDIHFSARNGEIHGLLGENGAGKTVLMNILYGLYHPDEGEIFLQGNKVNIDGPASAIKLGIGMVHQHFMLVPSLTVAENIILGKEHTKKGVLLDTKKILDEVKEFCDRYRLSVDLDAPVYTLPVGFQQRVEILKALYRGADILILDEPTAVLTPQEAEELFKAMRVLKEQGKTVVFISHKLKEVLTICDRITVLKRGQVVGTVITCETSESELAEMMVGRQVVSEFKKKIVPNRMPLLIIEDLKAFDDRGLLALNGVSFQINSNEILGVAGVEGNGQRELIEVITGLREASEGIIQLDHNELRGKNTEERIRLGISHIPEDRHARGLIQDFTVMENLILGSHDISPFATHGFVLDIKTASNFSKEMINDYSISTPNERTLTRHLSGGTQQRVVVAREFSRNPRLIVAAQPTRGLDVGATEYVRTKLVEMRDKGSAILLVSADLDEIWALSDRIAVIYEGKIVAIKNPTETDEQEIGLLMARGKND